MKKYIKPEISITKFDKDDIVLVVTSSGIGADDLEDGGAVGYW